MKARRKMKITEYQQRSQRLIQQLLEVWETAVCATHLFLSDAEIQTIKSYVPQALSEIPHLIVLENEQARPIAFMGIAGKKIEMLFVSNAERGKGFGKKPVQYGIEVFGINELAVNEQNPLARAFYEHMGFSVCQRAELDEQGNPYPILYMRLDR